MPSGLARPCRSWLGRTSIAPLATSLQVDTLPLLTAAIPDSGGQARRSALAPLGSDAAMQEATTRGIYDFHSMFYDATFGRLVKRRVARAINHMDIREGERVLYLGIGTGVSLHFYPRRARVFGIDLSGGMLREARKKIAERRLDHVAVFQADALCLPFA